MPATKLGRLVLEKKIKTIEEIYLYSLPVKGKSFMLSVLFPNIARV